MDTTFLNRKLFDAFFFSGRDTLFVSFTIGGTKYLDSSIELIDFLFQCDINTSGNPLTISVISSSSPDQVIEWYSNNEMHSVTNLHYNPNTPMLVNSGSTIQIKWNTSAESSEVDWLNSVQVFKSSDATHDVNPNNPGLGVVCFKGVLRFAYRGQIEKIERF